MRKWFIHAAIVALVAATLTACNSQADVVSDNLSKAADEFEINRRVVVINGITDEYLLLVEGLCSLGNYDSSYSASITCLVDQEYPDDPASYKKHIIRMGDNVAVVAEQFDAAEVSNARYRVIFRPEQIVPDIDTDK